MSDDVYFYQKGLISIIKGADTDAPNSRTDLDGINMADPIILFVSIIGFQLEKA